jgi:hypothetical protein
MARLFASAVDENCVSPLEEKEMFAQANSLECTRGARNSHFEPTLSRARADAVSITYSFCGSDANCAPVAGRVLSLFSRLAS